MSPRKPASTAPLWKTILAWAGLIVGGIGILAAFDQPDAAAIAGTILIGLAMAVPSAWWMWCQRRDSKIAAENADMAASHEQMRKYFTAEDAVYADALDGAPEIPAVNRRWKLVAPVSLALLVAGGMISPTPETATPAGVVGPTPTSSASPSPRISTTTATPTSTTSETSSPTSSEAPPPETVAPEPEREYVPAAPPPAREAYTPPPAPAAPPGPARAVAPPPAAGGAYFANCTQARAAGAAPLYQGSPGYRPGLDRDGDGIACE